MTPALALMDLVIGLQYPCYCHFLWLPYNNIQYLTSGSSSFTNGSCYRSAISLLLPFSYGYHIIIFSISLPAHSSFTNGSCYLFAVSMILPFSYFYHTVNKFLLSHFRLQLFHLRDLVIFQQFQCYSHFFWLPFNNIQYLTYNSSSCTNGSCYLLAISMLQPISFKTNSICKFSLMRKTNAKFICSCKPLIKDNKTIKLSREEKKIVIIF